MLDPLHDPLKGRAVVPQKYVDTLKEQGWVKPVRCHECQYWESDINSALYAHCYNNGGFWNGNDFCSDGKRKDDQTCGPDYCEIGGESNDNT